jgi:hypothetical protein
MLPRAADHARRRLRVEVTEPNVTAEHPSASSRRAAPLEHMVPVPRRERSNGALLALIGLSALAIGVLLYQGRGQTFFYDEWSFILQRRGISFDTFLEPHGGDHLSIVPVAIYKVMLQVFGLRTYLPYQLLVIAAHVACASLLWIYARRRLGAWLALVPAALLLFLGAAWQDLLWPFQIGFLLSTGAGVAMLLALEADPPRLPLVLALLLVSLASSGIGIAFLVVAAIEIAGGPERRRRAWIVVVPAAALVIWYAIYGGTDRNLAQPAHALRYALDMAAAGIAGLGGLGLEWGRPLLVAAVAGLVLVVGRTVPRNGVRLLALAAGAASFWLLTGASRADFTPPVPPDTSRYLYISAVFLLLAGCEVVAPRVLGRRAWTGLAAGVAVLCASSLGVLADGAGGLRDTNRAVRVELAALEVAGDRADRDFSIDPQRAPVLPAGPYLDAVDDFGSPAYHLAAIRRDVFPGAAALFDGALLRALGTAPQPATGEPPREGTPPRLDAAIGGSARSDGACRSFTSGGSGAALDVTVPAGGLIVSAAEGSPVELRFRRLASAYGAGPPAFTVAGGSGPVRLAVPPDRLSDPWHVRLSPRQDVRVCAGG